VTPIAWRRAQTARALLLLLVLGACEPDSARDSAATIAPAPIADQEDAVCGMLVREQSAPRAQVVHRDDSRFFFCSVGDLLAHLAAPSRHGAVQRVFVEVMDPGEDPLASHTGAHPWIDADEAVFVVEVERRGVMGAPVLVYRDSEAAAQVLQHSASARSLDFVELKRWWDARQKAR